MEVRYIDIRHIILVIIMCGCIFFGIKVIVELFNKKKSNERKKEKIHSDIQTALKKYQKNLSELQDEYQKLNSSFISYKQNVTATIAEMKEYTDEIINMCNEMIAFDDDFEEKLCTWSKLLDEPKNYEVLKKQIKAHIDRDIELKEKIKVEQEQRRIERQRIINKSFGLDLGL